MPSIENGEPSRPEFMGSVSLPSSEDLLQDAGK